MVDSILDLPNGVHRDVAPAVYHAPALGVVSKTALDKIHRSPAHYKAWLDGTDAEESSEALEFGAAFHCALLEPDRFAAEYAIAPDFGDTRKTDKTTKEDAKANKTRRDEWRTANAGKQPLDAFDANCIAGMVAAVRQHPLAGKMIRDGVSELTLKWRDSETGLTCKSRLDRYVEGHAMILDAKSTLDARWEAFRKDIAKWRYHVQDALYRSAAVELGIPVQYFVFLACEKLPPYAVATYTLDADGIGRGYSAARADIDLLATCVRDNVWPGYPVGIKEIELPPWA
ncbi:MAG TPA: PD-(D/E)XK nuclease-like domain-containing protein [Steroidobacteraceae bacterium]|jgi:exodeoxyribonuclease VIII|nr:PD-(D/E)XK nuclease-like domain-containing protein [Steroidobacteraceae bacterium]